MLAPAGRTLSSTFRVAAASAPASLAAVASAASGAALGAIVAPASLVASASVTSCIAAAPGAVLDASSGAGASFEEVPAESVGFPKPETGIAGSADGSGSGPVREVSASWPRDQNHHTIPRAASAISQATPRALRRSAGAGAGGEPDPGGGSDDSTAASRAGDERDCAWRSSTPACVGPPASDSTSEGGAALAVAVGVGSGSAVVEGSAGEADRSGDVLGAAAGGALVAGVGGELGTGVARGGELGVDPETGCVLDVGTGRALVAEALGAGAGRTLVAGALVAGALVAGALVAAAGGALGIGAGAALGLAPGLEVSSSHPESTTCACSLAFWNDGGRVLSFGGALEMARHRPRGDAAAACSGGVELLPGGAERAAVGDAEAVSRGAGSRSVAEGDCADCAALDSAADDACSGAVGSVATSAGGPPCLPFFLRFDRPNVSGSLRDASARAETNPKHDVPSTGVAPASSRPRPLFELNGTRFWLSRLVGSWLPAWVG